MMWAAGFLFPPLLFADATEWRINEGGFNPALTPRLATTAGGQPYVAYSDQEGRLLVGQPDLNSRVLSAPGHSAAGAVLESFGDRVYAAWLDGGTGEPPAIVFRALSPGNAWSDALILDSTSRPLPRIRLSGDQSGQIAAVWLGDAPETDGVEPEAENTGTPNYHLYGRRSNDGGKSWGDVQRITTGYDSGFWPALTMAGGRVHAFADVRRGSETLVVHAQGDDKLGWSEAESIKSVGSVLLIAATSAKNEPLAVWFGSEAGSYRLESAMRNGDRWKTYVFPGSDAYDIGSIALAAHEGFVYLAFSARSAQQTDQPRKNHIFYTRSSDGGLSWEPIQPFRRYPFQVTQDNFPQIALGKEGNVVIAWNDYRNLRGDLFYNISFDQGATWLDEDVPLDEPGVAEDRLFPFVRNFSGSNGTFYLLASRYRDDGLAVADLYLHALSIKPITRPLASSKQLGSSAQEKDLRARVSQFWKALVEADYKSAYALFDPYFRLRMPKQTYIAQSGRVKQLDFSIKDTKIEGKVARVAIEFTYEIPPLKMSLGGSYAKPPTMTRVEETWIYIDGDWFKEYHNEVGDFEFTRY
ncbi:hypothetical protein CKO42_03730 [Lamprobacter modestohalophilus]|uniref:Exo-alpha-sialidase n=1 Tax=Lamprobacter modestohalophilus TaxID=1064514 RepID=A0A9X0W698_9GAMM|nr:sialidase family protein [Lamprobacter modestohalophilus]MBK1617576.1 hypothetical protein [Lamprobacter modestohalophilus]